MKVLVVDDDPDVRQALRTSFGLQWPGPDVVTASSGGEALRLLASPSPDIVLLDVNLPDISGFAVLETIRKTSDVPVLLITARGEELDQVRGLELGADDYVVKPFGYLALLARIKAVLRRADPPGSVLMVPQFVAGDLAVDFERERVTRAGQPVALTPIEFRLLVQLVRRARNVVPTQTLLDAVWGPTYGATRNHLKVYIARLRAKIEADDGAHFIETVRGLGYRFTLAHGSAGPAPEAAPATT